MKRTTNIYIRVSEEEKAILLALAAKEGLTISAYIRRLAYLALQDESMVVRMGEG